jgi:Holliday junction resolvase RusA-like endonuclease
MITATLFGDPHVALFQNDSTERLIAALKKHAPRKAVDFPVLIRVKAAYKHLKSEPYNRRHGKGASVAKAVTIISDCLRPAGWIADDALVDQLVAEKCRVGDPYLEITMKERL